jgi:hypothetical protein
VQAGKVTRNIDLEINGLDTGDPEPVPESASHLTLATAQDLGPLPARVVGSASPNDPSQFFVNFGTVQQPDLEKIPDLYKFQTTRPVTIVWMSLEPRDQGINAVGDIDLFLFRPTAVSPVRLRSADNPRFSVTGTSHELIGVALGPGTWFLGVGAFDGSVQYQLRVIQNLQ